MSSSFYSSENRCQIRIKSCIHLLLCVWLFRPLWESPFAGLLSSRSSQRNSLIPFFFFIPSTVFCKRIHCQEKALKVSLETRAATGLLRCQFHPWKCNVFFYSQNLLFEKRFIWNVFKRIDRTSDLLRYRIWVLVNNFEPLILDIVIHYRLIYMDSQ